MPHEGPYRHGIDQETTDSDTLKKMQRQLENEKIGLSIELSKKAKPGDSVPLFNIAYPQDIAFYSLAAGILRYQPRPTIDPKEKPLFYDYYNEDRTLYVTLEADKKGEAKIFALSPEIDFAKIKLEEEKKEKQREDFRALMLDYESNIQDLAGAIKAGRLEKFADSNDANDIYRERLRALIINAEDLASTGKAELKKIEKKK